MWAAAGTKLAARGYTLHAALAASCSLNAAALLVYSCWRRCCYTRRAAWLTAVALLQSHGAAASVCISGFMIMAGRHSDNVLRWAFINALHNTGVFQASALARSRVAGERGLARAAKRACPLDSAFPS